MGFSKLLLFKSACPHFKIPNLSTLLFKFFSSQPPPKPSSLSPRMTFVFNQIKLDPADDYQTLHLIRAWRLSQNPNQEEENAVVGTQKDLILMHPWPEWLELIQRLVHQNYFDQKSELEDAFTNGGVEKKVRIPDLTKDWKTVEIAVFKFARDRFDILSSLSRKDLQILVGYGCPRTDDRTIIAAKRLRKYLHLDEGAVCSSCSMRNSCQISYLLLYEWEEARTTDVMRILLTYGFDPINRPAMNKSLAKSKSVKTSVRKLLHEVVKLSAVPIDPNLPPPVSKKPLVQVKRSPSPPKKRVARDVIEMKKGDWLCSKCEVMNFAKNTICLRCDAKRPKQRPLPGEWKCPR